MRPLLRCLNKVRREMPINMEAVSSSTPSILGCFFRGMVVPIILRQKCDKQTKSGKVHNCDRFHSLAGRDSATGFTNAAKNYNNYKPSSK